MPVCSAEQSEANPSRKQPPEYIYRHGRYSNRFHPSPNHSRLAVSVIQTKISNEQTTHYRQRESRETLAGKDTPNQNPPAGTPNTDSLSSKACLPLVFLFDESNPERQPRCLIAVRDSRLRCNIPLNQHSARSSSTPQVGFVLPAPLRANEIILSLGVVFTPVLPTSIPRYDRFVSA